MVYVQGYTAADFLRSLEKAAKQNTANGDEVTSPVHQKPKLQ